MRQRQKTEHTVVIEKAEPQDYMQDFVVLPSSFGTEAYDARPDVVGIRTAVDRALDKLDREVHFSERIRALDRVVIKPNLVSVYHDSGFDERDYPETTDPRVFEAVVRYVHRFTKHIVIAESSGKPMPTPLSFKVAGYDRIADHYGTELVALEQEPVVRYMLPKAEVMKEVYLPKTLEAVVEGKAFYISVPKMKTNLYTGVTLGFKNAMGTIPYFLRERNHNYRINKKLADLLYLFQPDLTIIDAIIAGEGNTPAPVDPVLVGKIIAGSNSVETDRITTRMMGFDPEENQLMIEAKRRGFGCEKVRILGDPEVIPLRPAISSFMDEKTAREFPNLLMLAGHDKNHGLTIEDPTLVTPAMALKIEQACTGGCLAAAKTGLDYYNYKASAKQDFAMCIVVGEGIPIGEERYWFDKTGKPYNKEAIQALPMKKLALGTCSEGIREACTHYAPGCCDPAMCMAAACQTAGVLMPIMSPENKGLPGTVAGMMETIHKRRALIRQGQYVDCPHGTEDRIFEIPELSEEDRQRNYIPWPLPEMSREEKRQQLKDQWKILRSVLGRS